MIKNPRSRGTHSKRWPTSSDGTAASSWPTSPGFVGLKNAGIRSGFARLDPGPNSFPLPGLQKRGVSTNMQCFIIQDLFTAGTDTSSIIIEWALAEMIKNPSIMKRAQQEMDNIVGRDRRLEESDIAKLPYLQAVVKEALRKHPSTPLSLPHYSFKACEVDGRYIPENTRLLVNVWAIGRDPDVWEDPLRFDPERFLSGNGAKIEPMGTDFELIPFGAGRRICAGMQAGLVFVQYFLGTLVHAFDWVVPDTEEMNMDEMPGLALPKAVPVTATVIPRLAPCCYA